MRRRRRLPAGRIGRHGDRHHVGILVHGAARRIDAKAHDAAEDHVAGRHGLGAGRDDARAVDVAFLGALDRQCACALAQRQRAGRHDGLRAALGLDRTGRAGDAGGVDRDDWVVPLVIVAQAASSTAPARNAKVRNTIQPLSPNAAMSSSDNPRERARGIAIGRTSPILLRVDVPEARRGEARHDVRVTEFRHSALPTACLPCA